MSKLEVMAFNLNRLKEIAKAESPKELEEARFRAENREWLLQSMQIALKIQLPKSERNNPKSVCR